MIELWELKGKGERRYSLFSWRTRMALKHKGSTSLRTRWR